MNATSSHLRWALRLFHLALAAAVFAFVVLRSHPGELWAALRHADLELAALAVLLNLPVALLAPLRSSLIFRRLGHAVPAELLIPTTILGFVAGGLTPAASGELLRASALRTRGGVPFEDTMVAVVYERVLALYLLTVSTGLLFLLMNLPAPWLIPAAGAAFTLCLLPWALALTVLPVIPEKESITGRGLLAATLGRLLALAGQLRSLLKDAGLLIQWSSVTSTMFGLIALQYWLLGRAVSSEVGLDEAWLAFGVSTLAAVASLIPLGLGILEGSLAAMLDRLGMTLAQGEIVALLVRATVTLPLVLAAFVCYLYLQRASRRQAWSI